MKKTILSGMLASVLVLGLSLVLRGASSVPDGIFPTDTEIVVSPNVINLSSETEVVTVHTNIPYSVVAGATVTLSGLDIAWWKSDNQGFFVAKFNSDEVKALDSLELGPVTLVLSGETTDGETFAGSDEVKVIDVTGTKR